MRKLAIFAVLATLTPWAVAQRGGAAGHSVAPHFHASSNHFAQSRNSHLAGLRRSSPYAAYGSLPFPFFGDAFDPDDIYSTGYPVASEPPAFLLQAVRAMADRSGVMAAAPPDTREPSPSQPLMIELQNGNYVRVNTAAVNGEALPLAFPDNSLLTKSASSSSSSIRSSKLATSDSMPQAIVASAAQDLPPAVLIFRDGHSEEVRDYTIADGMLYARGNYYADGYWNKKIDLAALNLSQTLQANNKRNVKFVLPASPNEVITRP